MTDIVNAVLVQGDAVLMARRSARRAAYPNRWSFPGGHVEPGETLEQALAREMREEIGVRPVAVVKVATLPDPADASVTYHMFAVTEWKDGAPRLIGEEHTELGWFTRDAAASLDGLALDAYRPLLRELSTR